MSPIVFHLSLLTAKSIDLVVACDGFWLHLVVAHVAAAYKQHENVKLRAYMGRGSGRLNMLPSHRLYWVVWRRRLPSFTNVLLPYWP